uniref:Capsid protein n=1 Tax=Genomoviridae sp. TaxID=2202565 RepID=A0A858NFX0_9VIRU|nr:MAG: capsid protein [Genomoviridae sp.]
MRRRMKTGRRSTKRRSRSAKKGRLIPTIRRVARRVALAQAETKRAVVLNEDYTYGPSTAYNFQAMYTNIFSVLGTSAQGVAQNQMIGTEIVDPLFVARMEMTVDWGLLLANAGVTGVVGVCLHAWLIATNDQQPITAPTAYVNSASANNWFIQPQGYKPQLNGNNVKVLKHWSKCVNPPSIPFGSSKPIGYAASCYRHKFVHKFKGKKEFETTSDYTSVSRVLRGWNYYFLVGYGVASTETLNANSQNVYMRCDRYLYYKDP